MLCGKNDKMLDRISKVLDIQIDFFTYFTLGDLVNSYNVNNSDTYELNQTNPDSFSGNDVVQQKIIANQENTYHPLDKVTELYERLLGNEREIAELKAKLK